MPQVSFGDSSSASSKVTTTFSLLATSPESFLDCTKPSASKAYSWLNLSKIIIDDDKKQMKLSFSSGAPSSSKTITLLLDNITFVYRPDGVTVDRFVHPGLGSDFTTSNFVFGFRVAGGTKANHQQQQVVNHLGSYIPDAPVILRSNNNNNNNNNHVTNDDQERDEQKRLLTFLAPPLLSRIHDPSLPLPSDVVFESAPASSPGFFKTFARTLVSRAKKRFTEGNFNLDLAYITSHAIAMGYPTPSSETESNYRNDMGDVFRFFATRHREKYWVINLCSERAFPPSSFGGRFSRLPFEDHEAPPIQLLFDFCQSMEMFLATGRSMVASVNSNAIAPFLSQEERAAFWSKNPPNPQSEDLPGADGRVVAVHCKAGKGRTGVSLSAWIYYERFMRAIYHNMNVRSSQGNNNSGKQQAAEKQPVPLPDVEDCARHFGDSRSSDGSGVTIVSQMRMLRYFARCLSELGMQLPPTIRPIRVHSVTVNSTPALDGKGGSKLFVIIRTLRKPIIWERMGRREWLGRGMKMSLPSNDKTSNSSSYCTMTPLDPVTLQTVGDTRRFQSPEWVVAGSTIKIPFQKMGIEVEDEFHLSLWHEGASVVVPQEKNRNKKNDNDDDDDDDDYYNSSSPPASPASPNNNKKDPSSSTSSSSSYLQHGAKGEYMACACWLHSSFLELPDPESSSSSAPENNNNDSNATSIMSPSSRSNRSGGDSSAMRKRVCLGLRQLDGCSKGKAIDLFEDDFGIEIEMSACHARPRNTENEENASTSPEASRMITAQEAVSL